MKSTRKACIRFAPKEISNYTCEHNTANTSDLISDIVFFKPLWLLEVTSKRHNISISIVVIDD